MTEHAVRADIRLYENLMVSLLLITSLLFNVRNCFNLTEGRLGENTISGRRRG